MEGSAVVELDRSALAERMYQYRLMAREGSGVVVLGPIVTVRGVERIGSGFIEVGPSPTSGQINIVFAVESRAEISIDVFDLAGRRVETLARGVWPSGTHTASWSGLGDGIASPAGVYIVRYRFPDGVAVRSVVRVR